MEGTANTVICLLTATMAGILRWIHIRENKKLAQAEEEAAVAGDSVVVEDNFQERRVTGFRYII
jgi:hypothetical protein